MITRNMVDEWICEDVPYLDLATELLGTGNKPGSIGFFSRDPIVLACVEAAGDILARCGLTVTQAARSGERAAPGEVFLQAKGRTDQVHKAWKVTLNLFEYACGIATRTARLVEAARAVNPDIAVLTTRKVFPGTKAVSIEAAVAGGALPHRLGLGETIIIFDKHLEKVEGGIEGLAKMLAGMKRRVCDKDICVEVVTAAEALLMTEAGADVLQFDKVAPDALAGIVAAVRTAAAARGREIKLIAAGGVNADNADAYAATGIDAISTTWVYFGKPADMSVVIG